MTFNRSQIAKNVDGDLTTQNKLTITVHGGMEKSAVLIETVKRVMRSHFGNCQRVDGYDCSTEIDIPVTFVSATMDDNELTAAWQEIRSLCFGLRYFLDTPYTPVELNGVTIWVGLEK